jgi:hypothetical protein
MNRRSFLKNSIGALLFGIVNSNPIAKSIVESIDKNPHDILLYLIQTTDGKFRIHGSKWIDTANKKISPFKFKLETFKPLGIFRSDVAYSEKRKLWKEYKIEGQCTFVSYDNANKRGIKAKEEGQIQSISSLGGAVGGKRNKEMGHGLFSLTNEQRIEAAKKGGKTSAPKMIEWCRNNNHWQNVGKIHKGVAKSKEQKEKISEKLKGRKLTKETCEKMSKSRMGRKFEVTTIYKFKNSAKKRRNAPEIIQCDINGKEIKLWDGLAEIYDYYNSTLKISKSSIRNVCLNWQNNTKGSLQHKGFIWKYKNN